MAFSFPSFYFPMRTQDEFERKFTLKIRLTCLANVDCGLVSLSESTNYCRRPYLQPEFNRDVLHLSNIGRTDRYPSRAADVLCCERPASSPDACEFPCDLGDLLVVFLYTVSTRKAFFSVSNDVTNSRADYTWGNNLVPNPL